MIKTSTIFITTLCSAACLTAQVQPDSRSAPDHSVLASGQWEQLDKSVDRALSWLATKQNDDGSFESIDFAQPAVTSFCLMAFLAQGESPVDGNYQGQLSRAVDYILSNQKANGLIAADAPNAVPIPRDVEHFTIGQPAVYNHAISALALTEAYGQCSQAQAKRMAPAINKAIAATLEMQRWEGKSKVNVGGWRYLGTSLGTGDSDLSVTGWQLMFLRSARNAGFEVPEESITSAVEYIDRCFLKRKDRKVHAYRAGAHSKCTRAMAGAGVLALAHAGKHDSQEAIASGEWILQHDFADYNEDTPLYAPQPVDRYHYGAFICTQATFQLGGKYWKGFFPTLVKALMINQRDDGSWPPERFDARLGNCYSTALCILSLSVPNQLLPIFQR